MVVPAESCRPDLGSIDPVRVVVRSDTLSGAGVYGGIRHVVYVKPREFNAADTPRIARELERMNARLLSQHAPYLLIGFGRWGSAEPWLGIPVSWSQISAARAIVEGTLPQMNPDPSQGAHFFHNLASLGIPYFSVAQAQGEAICWAWLDGLPAVEESNLLRHVLSPVELRSLIDGQAGKGVIVR